MFYPDLNAELAKKLTFSKTKNVFQLTWFNMNARFYSLSTLHWTFEKWRRVLPNAFESSLGSEFRNELYKPIFAA